MGRFSWEIFRELPIVGILRGFEIEEIPLIVETAKKGGLRNLEVTMNSPNGPSQIAEAVRAAKGALNVGAGTVIDPEQLRQAVEAGASFIVTPIVREEIIRLARSYGVPVIPGAWSPTEIVKAWELGASIVKVFPGDVAGPDFIRRLRAFAPGIPLMPTGGVDVATLPEFVAAGSEAFGVGGPLFDRERIRAGDWQWLRARVEAFIEAWRGVVNSMTSSVQRREMTKSLRTKS